MAFKKEKRTFFSFKENCIVVSVKINRRRKESRTNKLGERLTYCQVERGTSEWYKMVGRIMVCSAGH